MCKIVFYVSLCMPMFILGCETSNRGNIINSAKNPGPGSCDIREIADWIYSVADDLDNNDHYDADDLVQISETRDGWRVYIQRMDNDRLLPGGSPTAILDRGSCTVSSIYLTQ